VCGPSESTDDDKVVAWHWEEVKGPLREEKVSADTQILTLIGLVPGNYTFRHCYLVFSMGNASSCIFSTYCFIFLEVLLSIFVPMGMFYLVFPFHLLLQMFSSYHITCIRPRPSPPLPISAVGESYCGS
jgi:hypothetical protein